MDDVTILLGSLVAFMIGWYLIPEENDSGFHKIIFAILAFITTTGHCYLLLKYGPGVARLIWSIPFSATLYTWFNIWRNDSLLVIATIVGVIIFVGIIEIFYQPLWRLIEKLIDRTRLELDTRRDRAIRLGMYRDFTSQVKAGVERDFEKQARKIVK